MNTPIKITPIVENKSKCSNLGSEHGLSLLIECDGKRILFDTGASDLVVKNALELDINLDNIDCVVLSHGHYDHTGGLEYIKNKKTYVHPDIFIPKYKKINNRYEYIGIPYNKKHYEKENLLEFIEVRKNLKLTNNITLYVDFEKLEPNSFYLKNDDNYISDIFTDELVLSINTNNGLIIVNGCSHSGIINIINKITANNNTENIYALLGGFHLNNLTKEEVKQIAEKINDYHINMIGISHCTGNELAKHLQGSQVFDFNVGNNFIY